MHVDYEKLRYDWQVMINKRRPVVISFELQYQDNIQVQIVRDISNYPIHVTERFENTLWQDYMARSMFSRP